jgi:hypothetical protein
LRMTVVRSDTKCAALLPRAGRYPIAPSSSSSSSSSSWRHAHAHGLRGLLNLGGASSSSGPGAPGAAWTGQGGGGGLLLLWCGERTALPPAELLRGETSGFGPVRWWSRLDIWVPFFSATPWRLSAAVSG